MEVIATKKGYYKMIRNEGDKFTLVSSLPKGSKHTRDAIKANIEKQFSENWMKKAEKATKPEIKPAEKRASKLKLK